MSSSSWRHLLCWVWCVFLPAAFGDPRDFQPEFGWSGDSPGFSRRRSWKCGAADFVRIHAKPRWTVLDLRVFWTKTLSKKATFFGSVEKYWDVREYERLHYLIIILEFIIYKMHGYKQIDMFFCFGLMDLVVTFGDPRMDEFQLISTMLS